MSAQLLSICLTLAQVLLGLGMCCAAGRILWGPRAQDRVIGLDAVYVIAMLMMLTFGIRSGSTVYFEVAFGISVLGFVSTTALAKFLMRGEVIE